ncbi:hypothetical protein HON86_00695 [Candidatus Woesearchaeota archaeon]|jgi:hypothetical protein|nr:hypothetical protein [Candidatus Woesearchaeota archaeon]MBT4835122.1 hypothetical protein [Candidatus Woesearchaeota archaeon]MBT6735057.1 hypothetical protein [Candidatus Woesearchaeota archaeon]MBT7170076.1 hypothetical protein [Candidatus Woesearchaeota archaeon]MBT7474829.1 hypothetical protein [Candidatus Woesearchaeota archaeon]
MDLSMVNNLFKTLERKVSNVEGGKESDPYSHFNHVTKNTLMPISGYAEMYNDGDVSWNKIKDDYCMNISLLSRYLSLLNSFPEFKDGELNTKEGYFSEKFDEPNLEYISYAWKELNQK